MSKKKPGKELDFISWIRRDGTGTDPVPEPQLKHLQEERFRISCLSLTYGTYIAAGFNSYVVKLKKKEAEP